MDVLVKGNWYRKVLDPWDIYDWVYRPTDTESKKRGYRK